MYVMNKVVRKWLGLLSKSCHFGWGRTLPMTSLVEEFRCTDKKSGDDFVTV